MGLAWAPSNKRPPPPGGGPFGLRWSWRLAPVPPCPSVLPPGAGNEEANKALKAQEERAKEVEERVDEAVVANRQLHAPTVAGDDDGDMAAMQSVEAGQEASVPR